MARAEYDYAFYCCIFLILSYMLILERIALEINGINAGRNSMTAIAKSIETKLGNGTISNVSLKSAAKIAFSGCWNGGLITSTLLDNININPFNNQADMHSNASVLEEKE